MKLIRLSLILSLFLLVSGFTECYKPVTNSGLPSHIKTVGTHTVSVRLHDESAATVALNVIPA